MRLRLKHKLAVLDTKELVLDVEIYRDDEDEPCAILSSQIAEGLWLVAALLAASEHSMQFEVELEDLDEVLKSLESDNFAIGSTPQFLLETFFRDSGVRD